MVLLVMPGCDRQDQRWLQGYAEGEYLRMGAPAAGWLESVPVQRGDQVEAGAPVFTLEAEEQRAAVREAEAELARARARLADLKVGKRPDEIAEVEAGLAQMRAARTYAEQDQARQEKLARSDVAALS
ncbi:MAG: biotin/lipoyl-binding protein, partial [Geminicoccaceae bacterium]